MRGSFATGAAGSPLALGHVSVQVAPAQSPGSARHLRSVGPTPGRPGQVSLTSTVQSAGRRCGGRALQSAGTTAPASQRERGSPDENRQCDAGEAEQDRPPGPVTGVEVEARGGVADHLGGRPGSGGVGVVCQVLQRGREPAPAERSVGTWAVAQRLDGELPAVRPIGAGAGRPRSARGAGYDEPGEVGGVVGAGGEQGEAVPGRTESPVAIATVRAPWTGCLPRARGIGGGPGRLG